MAITWKNITHIAACCMLAAIVVKACDCLVPYGLEDRKRIDTHRAINEVSQWHAKGMPVPYVRSNWNSVFTLHPTNVVVEGVPVETHFIYVNYWTSNYGCYLITSNKDVVWLSKRGSAHWLAKRGRPEWQK